MQLRQCTVLAKALEVLPVQKVLLGAAAAEEQPGLAGHAGKVSQLLPTVLQEAPVKAHTMLAAV